MEFGENVRKRRASIGESVPKVGAAMAASLILMLGLWQSIDAGRSGYYMMVETETRQGASVSVSKDGKDIHGQEGIVENRGIHVQENVTIIPDYYRLGKVFEDWDSERQSWMSKHPEKKNHTENGHPRMLILTGSQPKPCPSTTGDYLLLRSFKNKVDYARIHDSPIFYNTALLDHKMDGFWSKLPLVRAAMEAHPYAEWLWWIDADLVITDMFFEIPLHTYDSYNLVIHGWESEVFDKRSVNGLNAGSFLIRNCAWSMQFIDRWASMGPKGPIRDLSGRMQSDLLPDRPPNYPGDDQSALIYFLIKENDRWGDKILFDRSYNLNGYWLDMIGNMDAIDAQERSATNAYGMNHARSFVTHFAGCQPCSGNRNPNFKENQCESEMERALNFADNQVLSLMGFRHQNLNSIDVERTS